MTAFAAILSGESGQQNTPGFRSLNKQRARDGRFQEIRAIR